MALDVTSTGLIATIVVFVIGFLVGAIIKKAFKLGIMVLALLIILGATGYYAFNLQPQSAIQQAFPYIAQAANKVALVATFLPIASTAFLVGLAIGIWKG